jgi:hypothetical protein
MKARQIAILGVLFSLMLIGGGFAYSITSNGVTTEVNTPFDNFFGRLASGIQYIIYQGGTFTVYGDELGCSKTANDIIKFKGTGTFDLNKYAQDAAFINWFRGSPIDGAYALHPGDSRQFLTETYLEIGKTNSISFTCDAGAYWNNECYGEIYFCPKPCYSNSDCSTNSGCEKSVLSQKIPNAGVCKLKDNTPTHKTNVYSCSNGAKTYEGQVSYGSINFCTDSSESKYLIGTTGQCLSTEPAICNTPTSEQNTSSTKSLSLTEEEWNTATPRVIFMAMCQLGSDCMPRENYSISCIYSEEIKNINKNALNKLKSEDNDFKTKLCNGLAFNAADVSMIGVLKVVSWLSGAGSYLYSWVCTSEDMSTANISGTCRAKETGGDFFISLAFFDANGDGKKDSTDGMIILFGGIALLFILIIMGGRK